MGTVTISLWLLITIIFTTQAVTLFLMSSKATRKYNNLVRECNTIVNQVYAQLAREVDRNRKLEWELRDSEKKMRELGTRSTEVIKDYGEALVFNTIMKYAPGVIDDVRRGMEEMHKRTYTQQLRSLHTKYFTEKDTEIFKSSSK